MTLEEFLDELEGLSPPGSRFKPHKYLLLLAVIDLIQSGVATANRFQCDDKLCERFLAHFRVYARPGDSARPWTPFFHLRSSGFWRLQAHPGKERALAKLSTVGSRGELEQYVQYASVEPSVYALLRDDATAEAIRSHIAALLRRRRADEDSQSTAVRESSGSYGTPSENMSLFEHERHALEALRSGLGNLGRMVANVQLYDDQSKGYYECDAILVTRTGIYVAELKHWSGHVRIAPYHWLIDGSRQREDPHRANGFKCRVLKGLYEHRFPTYPDVWVESVVVLTHPEATVENADSPSAAASSGRRNPTFASIADLLSYLRKRDATPGARKLSDAQVAEVTAFLEHLVHPPRSKVYQVPGYETVTYLSHSADRMEFLARPLDGHSRGLTRFRVFRMPEEGTWEERARAKSRAHNTADAVKRIGDHPNIHRVWVMCDEAGDIIEGSDWTEAGTLRTLLADKARSLPLEKRLEICHGLALALEAAHKAGIIHRAVKPEHVLMMNDIPKLADFDLSFFLDRKPGEVTVLPDRGGLKDDGYTAPELLHEGRFDEGTDLFALGVIACELLAGERPFATVKQFLAQGGRLSEAQLRRLAERGVPQTAIDAIRDAVVGDPDRRLKDASRMAQAFAAAGVAQAPPNARLNPGDGYDVFEIEEYIGEGAEAQLYRARGLRNELVALKLFNREVPLGAILREQQLASSVDSPYIVRCHGRVSRWKGERYFLVMEYIEGETLRERILRKERPDAETFRHVALGLMSALATIHGHRDENGDLAPLVHGDVKPDNILITATGDPKLTDWSVAGPPRRDEFAGTVGYVPPDRILGTEMEFAPDGDLFALGVTLWEWLFGARPYINPAVGDKPPIPAEAELPVPPSWVRWLAQAVATRAEERFASVEAMRRAFEEAQLGEKPPVVEARPQPVPVPPVPEPEKGVVVAPVRANPFVAYLNTLSNASAGNENAVAEAHMHSPFYDRLHVPNPLVEAVLEELLNQRHNVILTGNAGDGKTTIAAEIYRKLTGRWLPTEPRVEVPEHRLVIVKDMSELPASEQGRVLGEAAASRDRVYLVVTNTGRLLESARHLTGAGAYGGDVLSELLTALEKDEACPVLGGRFTLLNVGRTDSIDTACEVFRRMLAAENWQPCQGCRLQEACPVRQNVRFIQETEQTVVHRVGLAYRRLYEYGTRLTMRQMVGHLAYALTAGWECAQLDSLSEIALAEARPRSLFANRFFGDDGDQLCPEATQLTPVAPIREAGFGAMLYPNVERRLWVRDGEECPVGPVQKLLRGLCKEGREGVEPPRARRQARRLLYFFGSSSDREIERYLPVFLRSPTLLEYLRYTAPDGIMEAHQEVAWRCRVLQVVQEVLAAVRLPEGSWKKTDRLYITLNPRSSATATRIALASFATEDFSIRAEPGHRAVPKARQRLVLRHKNGAALWLDLPFLDYVAGRYEGEVAAQLSAFHEDRLQRFGAELRARSGRRPDPATLLLLRVGADRRLEPREIRLSEGRLEVV